MAKPKGAPRSGKKPGRGKPVKKAPQARRPKKPARPALTPRSQRWLEAHPGADNPRSKNYDPNWLQRSRGHKPKEHVTRAERSLAAGRELTRDKQFITALANRQAKRNGRDPAQVRAVFQRVKNEHGIAALHEISDWINRRHQMKDKRQRVWIKDENGKRLYRATVYGEGRMTTIEETEEMAAKYGFDTDYLYYR